MSFIKLRNTIVVFIVLFLFGCTNNKVPNEFKVALSFDDGPDDIHTELILDILKEKKIPATFFVLGNKMIKFPIITKRIINEGHSLGNHTYNHIHLDECPTNLAIQSIEKTEKIITSICGFSRKLFRPPWGEMTKEIRSYLRSQGFTIVLWDVNSHDWDTANYSTSDIVYNVIEEVNSDAIILFHDSDFANKGSRMNTVEALPEIIDRLKEKGYLFVKIEDIKTKANKKY